MCLKRIKVEMRSAVATTRDAIATRNVRKLPAKTLAVVGIALVGGGVLATLRPAFLFPSHTAFTPLPLPPVPPTPQQQQQRQQAHKHSTASGIEPKPGPDATQDHEEKQASGGFVTAGAATGQGGTGQLVNAQPDGRRVASGSINAPHAPGNSGPKSTKGAHSLVNATAAAGASSSGLSKGQASRKDVSLTYATILLGKVSHHAVTVQSVFPGPPGYTGVIYALLNGQRGIAWITNERNDVILGAIIGSHGQNYTRAAMIAHGLQPGGSTEARHSTSLPIGAPVPLTPAQAHDLLDVIGFPDVHKGDRPSLKAVAFIDPTQPLDRAMWPGLQSAIDSGALALQIAPSSLTMPPPPVGSSGDADAPGTGAMKAVKAGFLAEIGSTGTDTKRPVQSGATGSGLGAKGSQPSSGYAPVYANEAVLHALGITALPAFIYRGPHAVMLLQWPVAGGIRGLLVDLAGATPPAGDSTTTSSGPTPGPSASPAAGSDVQGRSTAPEAGGRSPTHTKPAG
jgi:hypothetical protein